MKYEIVELETTQELNIYYPFFFGKHDEKMFYDALYGSGLELIFGIDYVNIEIPFDLGGRLAYRARQVFRRYGIEKDLLDKLKGLDQNISKSV